MKKFCTILSVFLLPLLLMAQNESKWGIKFGGYVKNDIIYDSRQTVSLRQGHFLLYPKEELLDENGKDINAKPSLTILAIQTRLKGTVTAPDALGAKISGYIEGEFFGNIDANINTFRLRHAFIKLAWPHTELMLGQWWHAMFITECYPLTESFNTGAPFQPFSRNPQVRLTQSIGNLNIIATAMEQVDFVDNGPEGGSSVYLRNAALPELNLTLQYGNEKSSPQTNYLFGIGGDYKRLLPRLVTIKNYKTDHMVNNMAVEAFLKIKIPKMTFAAEGIYGQDFYSLTMLGGYAVKSIPDTSNDLRDYTPINVLSLWADIHSNGEKWQFGLFGGYTKNMGSNDIIERFPPTERQIYYSRGSNIKYIYRVSPRLMYMQGRLKFSAEFEYTAAAYGTPDDKGLVKDSNLVANYRLLLGAYLFF